MMFTQKPHAVPLKAPTKGQFRGQCRKPQAASVYIIFYNRQKCFQNIPTKSLIHNHIQGIAPVIPSIGN